MPTNYPTASDRLLYSTQKALDAALELGAIPERLFCVFYPLWRVPYQGHQRIATDYNELEEFIERGLSAGEGRLTSITALARFFGLEERFVRHLVNYLRSIGHISGSDDRLTLTPLGVESLRDGRRYQEQSTSAQLYFDGLGSRPLTLEHYKIPIFDHLPAGTAFQAFYLFNHRWDPDALQQLLRLRDRQNYNLPDEVTQVTPQPEELVYLPVYIVQRRFGPPADLPRCLVFSRVRNLRDLLLESAVNEEPDMQAALRLLKKDDLNRSVQEWMAERGLTPEQWYLNPSGSRGPQVRIDGEAFQAPETSTAGSNRRITTREIGRYALANNWCVWLTTDDAAARRQAAAEQALEWLQFASARPTPAEIQEHLAQLAQQLETDPLAVDDLSEQAARQRYTRAMERLESLSTEE